ncbi:MAG: stage II sporulation protein P [Ruminococcus sp.]
MGSKRALRGFSLFLASVAMVIGVFSIINRVGGYAGKSSNNVMAQTTVVQTTHPTETSSSTQPSTVKKVSEKEDESTPQPTTQSGKNYPVIEKQFGQDGITYKNISVKNSTDFTLDVEEELNSSLGFEIDDNHRVQVLIFHTHCCESYLKDDTGYYPADYYPRTTDNSENVTSVGDEIEEELKSAGIGVIHDKTKHDYPSYNGSYDRSLETIQKYMDKYENIKVVLDIHRDALGEGGESGKVKPVFKYKGQKTAQVMIMTGYNYEGGGYFPFWEENLRFALKLQKTAEDMYPGLTRPLEFGEYTYNLNVCNGSLLIEVGTDANTLDEAKRAGKMVGKALAKVLQNN